MGTVVLGALALAGVLVLVGTSHAQERVFDAASPAARSATFAGCSDAAIREVRFPGDVTIDEIRVELRDRFDVPPGAVEPMRVQVSVGRFARRVWVAPDASRTLRFSPGLRSDRFKVTLDPTFVGQVSTCVARIELVQGGTVLASIQP
jgi:hypothetical protein